MTAVGDPVLAGRASLSTVCRIAAGLLADAGARLVGEPSQANRKAVYTLADDISDLAARLKTQVWQDAAMTGRGHKSFTPR